MGFQVEVRDVVMKQAVCLEIGCSWIAPLRDHEADARRDADDHWQQHSDEWARQNEEWDRD